MELTAYERAELLRRARSRTGEQKMRAGHG